VELIVQLLQYHVIQQVTLAAYQINALVHCLTHGHIQLKLVTVYRLILWTVVIAVCNDSVIFKLLIINGPKWENDFTTLRFGFSIFVKVGRICYD
jgi:hypothetical protein